MSDSMTINSADPLTLEQSFRQHFHRDYDESNAHDRGCLQQMRLFRERFGRVPDTRSRSDLENLQRIELREHPDTPEVVDPMREAILSENGRTLDALAVELSKLPEPHRPLVHRFTPGLYIRELSTPRGTVSISKIHKTRHPFTISKGKVAIWDGEEWTVIEAPYTGITEPGTRRVSCFLEDTVWTTYHVTDLTDVDAIEAEIIEPHTPAGLLSREGDSL